MESTMAGAAALRTLAEEYLATKYGVGFVALLYFLWCCRNIPDTIDGGLRWLHEARNAQPGPLFDPLATRRHTMLWVCTCFIVLFCAPFFVTDMVPMLCWNLYIIVVMKKGPQVTFNLDYSRPRRADVLAWVRNCSFLLGLGTMGFSLGSYFFMKPINDTSSLFHLLVIICTLHFGHVVVNYCCPRRSDIPIFVFKVLAKIPWRLLSLFLIEKLYVTDKLENLTNKLGYLDESVADWTPYGAKIKFQLAIMAGIALPILWEIWATSRPPLLGTQNSAAIPPDLQAEINFATLSDKAEGLFWLVVLAAVANSTDIAAHSDYWRLSGNDK